MNSRRIERIFMSPNGDSCRLITACLARIRKLAGRVPARSAVRDAVLLAQRGHETLLEERGGAFRAVIIDEREERNDLRVLARVRGGRAVFARR